MPRSLARTAVHPPHRIGTNRPRATMNTFLCIILIFVFAVLFGISYFSFDIWSAKDQFVEAAATQKDHIIPPLTTMTSPQVITSNVNDFITNAISTLNPNNNNMKSELEMLLRPHRDEIVSEIDESRLVDLPRPNTINNNQIVINEDSLDVDGKPLELDEPFDEEGAIYLIRPDITPGDPLCEERFDKLTKGDIFNNDLSLQSQMIADASSNDDYIDWWDFPVPYQTRLDNVNRTYCNTIHKASYELHDTRVGWYEKLRKENKVANMNSNKFDENGCVIYKMNDYVQWEPPKNLLCRWKNTAIFWHTMHGTKIGWDFRKRKAGDHWVWDLSTELNDKRQPNRKCECPSNVAFIYADNQEKAEGSRLIEQAYENCNKNCHYFHVAKDYQPWDWWGKIGPVLELISTDTFQEQFEYVVLTDADDQTLIQSPINIVDKFLIYDADIVVGGEDTSYPQWMGPEKAHENRASPWSKHHQHLNAGAFMGNIEKMIPYLEYMTKDYDNFTRLHQDEIKAGERNKWRDQTCWREMYRKFYPKIKIDSLTLLWSRVDIYMYDL